VHVGLTNQSCKHCCTASCPSHEWVANKRIQKEAQRIEESALVWRRLQWLFVGTLISIPLMVVVVTASGQSDICDSHTPAHSGVAIFDWSTLIAS